MKHTNQPAVWLGLTLFLASWQSGANLAHGQESAPLATAQMTVRGPDNGVVGQRFTLEILITNTGGGTLKDLQVLAAMDANLDQKDSGGENLAKVDSIAPGKIHIVRLILTPTKKGPAGVDITLSNKNGEKREIRHVLPVFPAEDAPEKVERPNGASPLKVTVTTPKQCIAEQTGTFLLYVLNTDSQPTQDRLDLVVTYVSGNSGVPLLLNRSREEIDHAPLQQPRIPPGNGIRKGVGPLAAMTGNPVRQVRITLPSLAPNEGRTFPVEITPRRIGKMNLNITSNDHIVGSATVEVSFDAKLTLEQLLPAVKTVGVTPRLLDRLADVPEVALEDRIAKSMNPNEAFEHIAHLFDTINYVNAKKSDAFVEGLLSHRADVKGMPMSMGHACRLQADRAAQFVAELSTLRVAMANPNGGLAGKLPNPLKNNDHGVEARIAAMVQVLGPESQQLRSEMAKYLGSLSHAAATKALANLAIFSEEDGVRQVALDALKTRREKDYGDILLQGLNYPWPAVAQRASEAIVKLKRTDLLPQVADVLDRADPRAPQEKDADGKKVQVVREVVKVNHLRNCILCHAPRSPEQVPQPVNLNGQVAAVLLANVPIPNQALPPQSFSTGGYGQSFMPETMVRFDVTYLRQDFSLMLPVADAQPWPANQRFDFLVRSRTVSEQDANAYRELLRGGQSPYQAAALSALRQLTGRDADATTAAWRKVLQ